MPSTDRLKLPLYTDEETPDISTSGHYNESMRLVDAEAAKLEAQDTSIKADLDSEVARATAAEQANASAITAEVSRATVAEKKNAADITAEVTRATAAEQANAEATAALGTKLTGVSKRVESNTSNIAKEVTDRQGAVQAEATARTEADTALGGRIDNAEAEISANSADLTGIKGLTYGTDHVTFLENENGSYTSPALEEIAEQIDNAGGATVIALGELKQYTNVNISESTHASILSKWPNVIVKYYYGDTISPLYAYPCCHTNDGKGSQYEEYIFSALYSPTTTAIVTVSATKNTVLLSDIDDGRVIWNNIESKPFSTIGNGLKVSSNALTVDTSALPSAGLTFHHQKRMITNTLSGDGVDMGGAELASAEFYSPELAKIFTIENHSTTPTSITLIFGKSASAQTYVNTATVLGPSNTQGQIPVLLSNGTFETWTVQIVSSVFRLIHPARTAALSGDWFLWAIDYIA